VSDTSPSGFESAGVEFAQRRLELGEELFDGVKIRRMGRKEEQELGANGADSATDRLPLMAAEIVHGDDVARSQGRDEHLLHIGEKASAVDRAIAHARRHNTVAAQGG
jgi:hypothetical protein